MRNLLLPLLVVVSSGCGGGTAPELYALVVDYFAPPASCYMTAPNTTVSPGPLATVHVEVWDGPDSKAYLTPTDAALNIDMGDAPNVQVTTGQAVEGAPGAGGWTFTAERTSTTTVPISGAVTTVKTKASLTFPRGGSGKGTLSMSSSQSCTGQGCPSSNPACTIDNVALKATLLKVDFLQTP